MTSFYSSDLVMILDLAGFLPTFGPAYVYLYGSTRDGAVMDEHASLNAGLGEGIAYRGRVLLSVRCQITDQLDVAPSEVEVENTLPIQEVSELPIQEVSGVHPPHTGEWGAPFPYR